MCDSSWLPYSWVALPICFSLATQTTQPTKYVPSILYASKPQLIPNTTPTVLEFDTPSSSLSITPLNQLNDTTTPWTKLQVQTDGVYLLRVKLQFGPHSGSLSPILVTIFKNDAAYDEKHSVLTPSISPSMHETTEILKLVKGDTISVYFFQHTGSDILIGDRRIEVGNAIELSLISASDTHHVE